VRAPALVHHLNEPNLQAFNHYLYPHFPERPSGRCEPTVECLAHLLEAHVRAYRLIHELYARSGISPMVSFNNYASDLYWSDTAMLDLLFAPARKVPRQMLREDLAERPMLSRRASTPRGSSRCTGRAIFSANGSSISSPPRPAGLSFARLGPPGALLYERAEVPLDYIAFDYYDPSSRTPCAGDLARF